MKDLIQSALVNSKISIVQGGGCPCQAWMKRAVVELSADISAIMPHMSRLIGGCAYNPGAKLMGFRVKDMGVIVEAQKITINNAEDEATAKTVIDWLRDVANAADADDSRQQG
jgi:ArsR family metal-binding transcriptional regulator